MVLLPTGAPPIPRHASNGANCHAVMLAQIQGRAGAQTRPGGGMRTPTC